MNDLTKYDFGAFAACDLTQDLKLGSAGSQRWSRGLLRMQDFVSRAGSDLQKVMDTVVTCAIEIVPQADGAVVAMADDTHLTFRAVSGAANRLAGSRIAVANSFSGLVLEAKTSLRCDDTALEERIDREKAQALGARSIMAVPLPHRGEIVGVLLIYSGRPHAFDDSDMLTAQLLAGPLAMGFASATEAVAVAARQQAELHFAATFEQAAVGIAHVSTDGRFVRVNNKFCDIAGYAREQLLNATFQDITYADDLDIDLGYLKNLVAGRIPSYALEKRYVRADGGVTWIMLTVSMVRHPDGSPDFFVGVIEDINARKQAEQESTLDPLTGLLNRRGVSVRLERELGRGAQSGEPITVAYLDLDGFKALNDSEGHAAGDRCLIEVGQALSDMCRPGDVVARLGGDEFLILLPGLSYDAAPVALQRLLAGVKSACRQVRGSMGAVALDGAAGAPEAVVAAADALMYRAKKGGKDRFVLEPWRPEMAAA